MNAVRFLGGWRRTHDAEQSDEAPVLSVTSTKKQRKWFGSMQRSRGDAGVSHTESYRLGRSHLSRFVIGFAREEKTLLIVLGITWKKSECEDRFHLYVMLVCGMATSTFSWIVASCTSDTGRMSSSQFWFL